MDNNTLALYIHELRNQLFHTQGSLNLFNAAVQQQQIQSILYSGQQVLMPVGQVSALLWPSRARARSRGESLRKMLSLPEKHVLNDRRLSEISDRCDEKMDEWIAATRGERVMIDFVGDIQEATDQMGSDLKAEGIYRAFDTKTAVFYYRGVGFNLRAIADAMSDVGQRINVIYGQLFPEQMKAEQEHAKRIEEAQQQAQAETEAQQAASEPADLPADDENALGTFAPKTEAKAQESAAEKPKRQRTSKKKTETEAEA